MERSNSDQTLFFSIFKHGLFKKLNGTGRHGLEVIFVFIFNFFNICFFIFIILKLI